MVPACLNQIKPKVKHQTNKITKLPFFHTFCTLPRVKLFHTAGPQQITSCKARGSRCYIMRRVDVNILIAAKQWSSRVCWKQLVVQSISTIITIAFSIVRKGSPLAKRDEHRTNCLEQTAVSIYNAFGRGEASGCPFTFLTKVVPPPHSLGKPLNVFACSSSN